MSRRPEKPWVLYVRRASGGAWVRLTCFAHEGAAARRALREVETSWTLNEADYVVGARLELRGRVVQVLARSEGDYPPGIKPWRSA